MRIGDINTLAAADFSAGKNLAENIGIRGGNDLQADAAVIDLDAVAGNQLRRKPGIGNGNGVFIAFDLTGRENKFIVFRKNGLLVVLKGFNADFGSFGVKHKRDRLIGFFSHFLKGINDLLVAFMSSV